MILWMAAAFGAEVVAVLPFASNAVREELLPLGPATTDMLVTDLTRVPNVVVVERARILDVLRELDLQASGFVDPATAVEVGKGLGANLVVVGSVNTASVGLRIDARLVDVSTGQAVLGASSTGAESDFFALESDVARQLYAHFGDPVEVLGSGKPATLEDAVAGGERLQASDTAYLSLLKGVTVYRRERLHRVAKNEDAFQIVRGPSAVLELSGLESAGVVPVGTHRSVVRNHRRIGWTMLGTGLALSAIGGASLASGSQDGKVNTLGVVGVAVGPTVAITSLVMFSPRKNITKPTHLLFESAEAADTAIEKHNRELAEELGLPERRRMEIEAERISP